MATLTVVMVLFFVMALVAAYTNRNLIFEQRVAANSYRAERAMAAAEAGIDWAILMLNSGRIDMSCQPSSAATDLPWRQRFMAANASGSYTKVPVFANWFLFPSCVNQGAQLTCVCPTEATPNPSPHAVKDWPLTGGGTAFRVAVINPSTVNLPGAVAIDVRGCGSPGQGTNSCASESNNFPAVDGMAQVRQTLGLVRALPIAPSAALTAGGSATVGGTLRASNPDSNTGLTVHAGGSLTASVKQLAGPAGGASDGQLDGDLTLRGLVPANADRFTNSDLFFRAMFGMQAPTYRDQPAVVRFNCGATACTAADVQAAAARYPGLSLWFDGDLDLGTLPVGNVLGDSATPLFMIVTGRFRLLADIDFTGFIYAPQITWDSGAANAVVRGAMVAVEDFTAPGNATLVYDAAAMQTIQQTYGSFVRAPGGWNRAF